MASPTATKFPGVALITGAGGTGIGAATVQALVRAGCTRLALTDLNPTTLSATIQTLNRDDLQIFQAAGDIADEAFVEAFVSSAHKHFGRIDYTVNCAGILGPSARSSEVDVAAFDRINGVNYRGSWLVSRAVLGRMVEQEMLEGGKERGSVVNVASQLGIVGRPEAAPYCASKAAIIGMTKSDAIDYSSDGIRVNCVCPGVIDTPMTGATAELKERMRPAINVAPMQRMGKPEEVANAILFLLSSDASFVQGHALVVDGGYTIN